VRRCAIVGLERRQGVTGGEHSESLWVAAALALSVSPPLPAAVVVSSKLSSESAMIGGMIRLLLNANGIQTVDRTKIGATPVVRKALIAGEVDLYVEYTGNAGFFFNVASNPAWKDCNKGTSSVPSSTTRPTDRLAHTGEGEQRLGAGVRRDVALANTQDHERLRPMGGGRRQGGARLFGRVRQCRDPALTREDLWVHDALRAVDRARRRGDLSDHRRCSRAHQRREHGHGLRYDGGIVAANLQILEDDRHDQPVYAPVPIVREAVLKANPQIAPIVKPLMESFSRETLQQLNARVQIDGESEGSVAEDYLKAKGFLK